jgi:hypothetical protein
VARVIVVQSQGVRQFMKLASIQLPADVAGGFLSRTNESLVPPPPRPPDMLVLPGLTGSYSVATVVLYSCLTSLSPSLSLSLSLSLPLSLSFSFNQQLEYKVFCKLMCWLAGSLTCRLPNVMWSPPAKRSRKFSHY